jgi:dienelactone hydrolase
MRYPTRRAGRRSRWAGLLAGAFVSAWLLAAVPGAAGATWPGSSASGTPLARADVAADLELALPPPTGPLPIGVRSGFVADPSRIDPATGKPRTLLFRVWYPARHAATGRPAPYFSAAVEPVVEQYLGVPTGTFAVDTHASADARMRRHIRGVILVSAGLGEPVALQTAQVIELASRGWVLVTFDHPHDTFVVEQPDGTLIFSDLEPSQQAIAAAFEQRVLDVGVVLRELSALLPRRQHRVAVGMFGFSIGGAAAAEAMLRYPRLRAGVDLDGTAFGRVMQEGLDKPFGIMLARHPLAEDPKLSLLISHLRGPHPLKQLDVEHHGFTDFVVLNPEASLADPALGALLESNFATGVDSVAAGTAALTAQRRFLTTFMRRYLKLCHDDGRASWRRTVSHAARSSRCPHGVAARG